jgi:pantetheine-phosphate adenylyltransferase
VKKRVAVYPGSFDPITNGHLDIIKRAGEIFDEVVVAILENRNKSPLFSTKERMALAKEATKNLRRVKVVEFCGLLVDFMKENHIKTAIRGLRAVSDLEYEFQLAHTNRLLYPEMETVFLMPSAQYVYLASTTVREVACLGGELKSCVPENVRHALKKKFKTDKK